MQIVKQQSGAERGAWLAIAGQWVKVEIDADRFSGSLNATVIVTLEMIDLRHFFPSPGARQAVEEPALLELAHRLYVYLIVDG